MINNNDDAKNNNKMGSTSSSSSPDELIFSVFAFVTSIFYMYIVADDRTLRTTDDPVRATTIYGYLHLLASMFYLVGFILVGAIGSNKLSGSNNTVFIPKSPAASSRTNSASVNNTNNANSDHHPTANTTSSALLK